jgi:hypothetical protein
MDLWMTYEMVVVNVQLLVGLFTGVFTLRDPACPTSFPQVYNQAQPIFNTIHTLNYSFPLEAHIEIKISAPPPPAKG